MRTLVTAIATTIVLMLLTGVIYPLVVFLIAQGAFPWQANGSLLSLHGRVVGSELIGQNFNDTRYFHPRPSVAGDKGYDATSSGGSNLGPTNRKLIDDVNARLREVLEKNPGATPEEVPVGMVTASASGLDPEISPANAELQAPRVAKARGLSESVVDELIRKYTRQRFAGVFGEPGVNVLRLNLALDRLARPQG